MDNRTRAVPSFRGNPSRESKKSVKRKERKLMLAHQETELALGTRSTKTCSTQKVQESFVCGS